MSTISQTEPLQIVAGDTAKWQKSLPDYPASALWVLSYALVRSGAAPIVFSGTASGDVHAVTVAASTTAAWPAADYAWQAYVTQGSERYTVGEGRLTVRAGFAAASASGIDARTQARRTLEAIEAVIEGRASSSTQEYQIAGRALKYIPIPELLALRDVYRRDVATEDKAAALAAGRGGAGRILVRML